MEPRQQHRVAENELLFRRANEVAAAAVDEFEGNGATYDIVCECALPACEESLQLAREEYRHVRSNAGWFAVAPAHVVDGVERVVADQGSFWIVEKTGEAGRLVEAQA